MVLQAMDKDHNGKVDFHEFYDFIKHWSAKNKVRAASAGGTPTSPRSPKSPSKYAQHLFLPLFVFLTETHP